LPWLVPVFLFLCYWLHDVNSSDLQHPPHHDGLTPLKP
jgi:hypothetical protein